MTRTVRAVSARRRGADRRGQLAGIAADLFRRHGYHNVGVDDIAAAAGITGPAVYRHFRNKQAILTELAFSSVDDFGSLVDDVLGRPSGPVGAPVEPRLKSLTAALAPFFIERRELYVLWVRERRNLDPESHDELRARLGRPMVRWTEQLCRERPELSSGDANLLCWAALSVLGSPAHHRFNLPKARFEQLLREMADAVLHSDVVLHDTALTGTALTGTGPVVADGTPPETTGASAWPSGVAPRSSRRELLLAAAAGLFRERGFHATSMEDIGSAAGIAGPSVYRHFSGKQDLLVAACLRMADRIRVGAEAALAASADPAAALAGLMRSYVVTARDNSDLIAVYISEAENLPARDQAHLRRIQRAHLEDVASVLVAVRPELSEREARVMLSAVTTLVNDLVRMRRFRARPHLTEELTGLTLTALSAVPVG